MQRLLENATDWSEAKRYGIEKLRGGELENAKTLLGDWEAIGLFLVPRGELECWWREGPATNKPEWVIHALTKIEETDDIADVDPFAARVCQWFGLAVREKPIGDLRQRDADIVALPASADAL